MKTQENFALLKGNFSPSCFNSLASSLRFFSLILLMVFLGGTALQAQCVTAPGTGRISGNVSFGDPINWANPNRVTLSDDLYARASLDPGDTTKYLMVRDFGFLINGGATITGVQLLIEKSVDLGGMITDGSIRLMKNGVILNQEKANPATWGKSDVMYSYGGPTDLWGETWTPADIMDPGFGAVVSATSYSGPKKQSAQIDYIGIVIYYTGGGGCTFSVTLDGFSVSPQADQTIRASWVTFSEQNNDFFTLERSANGIDFEPVNEVAGAGNSYNRLDYETTDLTPLNGVSFYRLKQTDFDGNTSYSNILSVVMEAGPLPNLIAFPNPATSQLNLSLSNAGPGSSISLYDLSGKLAYEQSVEELEANVSIDVSALPRGMYLVKYRTRTGAKTERIILQ